MSGDMNLRSDIAREFEELRRELGFEDEEPSAVDEPAVPPSPATEEPVAPAVPPPVEISPEPEPEEDERYPGSRHVRRGVQEASTEAEEDPETTWDSHPIIYMVNGQEVEFFTISALADAVNRKTGTIRKWETNGYLPPSRYRSPGEKKRNRLYTRKQIEGIVALLKDEGLMDPERKMRIDQTKFPDRVRRLFAALEQRR